MDAMSNSAKTPRVPKQVDAVTQTAQAMVRLLEAHDASRSTWVDFSALINAMPEATAETAIAALLKPPAKSRIVVACPTNMDSPLLLKDHLETFAANGDFLRWLTERGCSAETPVRSLTELTQSVDKRLKKLIDNYWPAHTDQLPAGLAPKQINSGRKKLFAIHDLRFPLPEEDLSQRLVAALQAEKESGGDAYPTTWHRLKSLVDHQDRDELLQKAASVAPFAEMVRELTGGEDRFLAFSSDVPGIIYSETFLKQLVQSMCRREVPETKLSLLAKRLTKDLQPSFFDHWVQTTELRREFDFATLQSASTKKKQEIQIRDNRFPPPELVLAEDLVTILASQKAVGGTAYPSSLRRLFELNGAATTQAVRTKAVQSEPFLSQVVVALTDNASSAVAFRGDEELLTRSPTLLATILDSLRTSDNQAIGVDKIMNVKSLHPSIRAAFQAQIVQRLEERSLPGGIGAIKQSKKWSLFRFEDVIGSAADERATAAVNPPGPAMAVLSPQSADNTHFAEDFDAVFSRLDGKLGLPHYASLVDLRPALSQYSRDVFDRELLKLRQAGRYSLSLVEGRFGLSAEEQQACLIIDHVPHLLVQKRESSRQDHRVPSLP